MPWKDKAYARLAGIAYRAKNADAIKARLKANRSAIRATQKAWYLAHKVKQREYVKANRDRIRENYRKWAKDYYKTHPEKLWRKQHPEQARETLRKSKAAWLLKPGSRAKLQSLIRARKAKTKSNSSAESFYAFVRSKERIKCYYCGDFVSGKEAHIDHVIALARDGNHASENLAASCPKCNLQKRDSLPSEIDFINQRFLNL